MFLFCFVKVVLLTLYFTDYLRIPFQLTAFGEEQEIPLWGIEAFGEQVIISQMPILCIWFAVFFSLYCLDTWD